MAHSKMSKPTLLAYISTLPLGYALIAHFALVKEFFNFKR